APWLPRTSLHQEFAQSIGLRFPPTWSRKREFLPQILDPQFPLPEHALRRSPTAPACRSQSRENGPTSHGTKPFPPPLQRSEGQAIVGFASEGSMPVPRPGLPLSWKGGHSWAQEKRCDSRCYSHQGLARHTDTFCWRALPRKFHEVTGSTPREASGNSSSTEFHADRATFERISAPATVVE